ncbi:MAG: hypothetical protein HY826_13500 [Actinobacteria bacterium]|nr:hypothetical protein [Actinomycetota bacterium]
MIRNVLIRPNEKAWQPNNAGRQPSQHFGSELQGALAPTGTVGQLFSGSSLKISPNAKASPKQAETQDNELQGAALVIAQACCATTAGEPKTDEHSVLGVVPNTSPLSPGETGSADVAPVGLDTATAPTIATGDARPNTLPTATAKPAGSVYERRNWLADIRAGAARTRAASVPTISTKRSRPIDAAALPQLSIATESNDSSAGRAAEVVATGQQPEGRHTTLADGGFTANTDTKQKSPLAPTRSLSMIGLDRVQIARAQAPAREIHRLAIDLDDARVALSIGRDQMRVNVVSDPSDSLGVDWVRQLERTMNSAARASNDNSGASRHGHDGERRAPQRHPAGEQGAQRHPRQGTPFNSYFEWEELI